MAFLQSRKSNRGLTSVWDIVVRSVTGSGGVRSGPFGPEIAGNRELPGLVSSTFHFWKRHGWRFYPVNTHYFIPKSKRPGSGYPVTVLVVDPASLAGEWLGRTVRLCEEGSIVIMVELPAASGPVSHQAEAFMEAAWVAIALKIGGLTGIPVHLTWWGAGEAATVVEHAARLTDHKYYLPPVRVVTRAFDEPDPAQAAQTEPVKVEVFLAKAS